MQTKIQYNTWLGRLTSPVASPEYVASWPSLIERPFQFYHLHHNLYLTAVLCNHSIWTLTLERNIFGRIECGLKAWFSTTALAKSFLASFSFWTVLEPLCKCIQLVYTRLLTTEQLLISSDAALYAYIRLLLQESSRASTRGCEHIFYTEYFATSPPGRLSLAAPFPWLCIWTVGHHGLSFLTV